MKFVFASDSFKGSLTSAQTAALLEEAAKQVFPDAECVSVLMADGGEGTLAAIAATREGEVRTFDAHDALMRPVTGKVFVSGNEAFVEVAQTCGLAQLDRAERNPHAATSYGVGESIRFALDQGCTSITVGMGGSATNDAGMGCLRALGVRFLDVAGQELAGSGGDMGKVASIDLSGMDPRIAQVQLRAMCDVSSPLVGPGGATFVFGSQKGADWSMIEALESGMLHLIAAARKVLDEFDVSTAGFGAAGGLGMALATFCKAQLEPGVESMMRWVDFDTMLEGADLVVTGEGQIDSQSMHGKVPLGIAAHAKRAGAKVAAICGTVRSDWVREELANVGFDYVIETSASMELDEAMANAEENYRNAAQTLFASLS